MIIQFKQIMDVCFTLDSNLLIIFYLYPSFVYLLTSAQAAEISLKFLSHDRALKVVQTVGPRLMELKRYEAVCLLVTSFRSNDSFIKFVYSILLLAECWVGFFKSLFKYCNNILLLQWTPGGYEGLPPG